MSEMGREGEGEREKCTSVACGVCVCWVRERVCAATVSPGRQFDVIGCGLL